MRRTEARDEQTATCELASAKPLARELVTNHVAVVLELFPDLACVELPEVGESSHQVEAVITVPYPEFFSFF
jgi:hypothetical protein